MKELNKTLHSIEIGLTPNYNKMGALAAGNEHFARRRRRLAKQHENVKDQFQEKFDSTGINVKDPNDIIYQSNIR